MNGDVLKKVFLIIVVSLCLIALILTLAVLCGKFPIDSYEKVMEILGIPTLIGMIVTSFIHSNIKDSPSDVPVVTTTKTEMTKTQIPTTEILEVKS